MTLAEVAERVECEWYDTGTPAEVKRVDPVVRAALAQLVELVREALEDDKPQDEA